MNGHLVVEPAQRAAYLQTCRLVVELARRTPGCLDFALSADVVDDGRVDVLERWATRAALDAFRGDGVGEEQGAVIRSAEIVETEVGDEPSPV